MKTGDSGASGQRCEPDEGVLELHFFFFLVIAYYELSVRVTHSDSSKQNSIQTTM